MNKDDVECNEAMKIISPGGQPWEVSCIKPTQCLMIGESWRVVVQDRGRSQRLLEEASSPGAAFTCDDNDNDDDFSEIMLDFLSHIRNND